MFSGDSIPWNNFEARRAVRKEGSLAPLKKHCDLGFKEECKESRKYMELICLMDDTLHEVMGTSTDESFLFIDPKLSRG